MNGARTVTATLVTMAALLALSWCARVPIAGTRTDHGLLRLSWRMAGRSSEQCRQRTEAELAALPVHMRAPSVCERHGVSYRLIVQIDDARADTSLLKPAGAMGDRPVFVLHETRVTPGDHRVGVRVEPITHGARATSLAFNGVIHFSRNQVDLITVQDDAARLVHRVTASPAGAQ